MSSAVMLLTMIVVCLAIGLPVGIALLLPCMILVTCIEPVTTVTYLSSVMFTGVGKFSLMAVPFFILGGAIMEKGGISKRLVRMANSLVGGVTGSLGMVAILASMFFGAVSGSATATVAAIGSIILPEMVRNGYNKVYSVALIAAAGGLGTIVPPSFPMVIYGLTNNVSVGDLFISGLVPACLVGGMLMLVNYIISKKKGYKGSNKISLKEIGAAFKDGLPALFMPVIILGGIYGGIFTVTEAAVVAVVYGIIVGVFIYKEISFKETFQLYKDNAVFLGGVMLTIAPCAGLARIFSFMGITEAITNFFVNMTSSYVVIMLCIFVILFLAGMILDATPCIVILSPILLPVVKAFGMDEIQFGMVMIVALSIAYVTPPVACNLFTASAMTSIPIAKITARIWPFIIALIVCLFIIMFVPWISTCLVG